MYEKSIADPLKDIRSSYQSLQKLINCASADVAQIRRYQDREKQIKSTYADAIAHAVDPLKDITNPFQSLQKQMENSAITKLLKQEKQMGNFFKLSEIVTNSPFVKMEEMNKQFAELFKVPNVVSELLTQPILPTLRSINFPNIIIPRPADNSILPLVPEERRTPPPETDSTIITDEVPDKKRIFIGHGHSNCWEELRDFVTMDLRLFYDEFNRSPAAGLTISERLEQMLEEAEMAFLIMTAQNEYADGTLHASNNVIHEIGLFQGKLGFKKAIILLEEGCEEFSNIHGLVQIRFPRGNIKAAFEEIRQVLEREGVI